MAALLVLLVAVGQPVQATELQEKPQEEANDSATSPFTNGAKLRTDVWIKTKIVGTPEFPWKTKVVIEGGSKPAAGHDWVQNTTSFQSYGVASSVTEFGQTSSEVSETWRNDAGQRGSFQSGAFTINWRTMYVEGHVSGSAFYNGQTVHSSAQTSILT
ncbi:hypothetical protein [Salininema proteolyticum]|uniref:Uncharacterized protein n=1 Tax=Salininema proteolyticum TaxID=1607685 RepID=A0ABV8U3E9_9ACTN